MNILVTGGAGFIGSHTADALVRAGFNVRILDNLQKTVHPKGIPGHLNPRAEFVKGDVRDKRDWEKALVGIDAVYHFAAYQDYLTDFSTFFHVNAVSTALLYEILVEKNLAAKIRKVIVAASQAVMGEGRYRCPACFEKDRQFSYPAIRLEAQLSRGEWDHCCDRCGETLEWQPSDETVVKPCNQYALSKFSQEQIALELGKRYDIPSVVMRYSIVQGPRQSFYNAYSGAMRIFALSLYFDRRPIIFEDGNQIRDFVNIQDVVDANLLVLEKSSADGRVFNVGGDRAWTVNAFYETMQAVVGRNKEPLKSGYYRFGDTRHIFSDISRLQSLGWNPSRDIRKSIADYWEYLNTHQDTDNILEFAEKQMKQQQVIRQTQTIP
ncbi:MAG: SDR family NAD(P)-dependent oxidoreductase [Thermodesulfobacteriota bacterium]